MPFLGGPVVGEPTGPRMALRFAYVVVGISDRFLVSECVVILVPLDGRDSPVQVAEKVRISQMYFLDKDASLSETTRECRALPSLCIFFRRGKPPHSIPLTGRISPSRHCIFIKQEESLHHMCCGREDAPHCIFCRMGDISPLYLLQKGRCSLPHFSLDGRSS